MSPDRRTHPRYTPVENAYAALGSEYSNVGQIRDFSLGGLAIEYIQINTLQNDNAWVDVFVVNNTFHIHGIPCCVVYDIPGTYKTEGLEKRRCGIKFTSTSEHQRLKIKEFLSEYVSNGDTSD
jgi:c-di-GMP-binding flagellar brake protein YcgR